VEATKDQVRSALSAYGLPIDRVDLEEPGATTKRAAWVRLVAPELPWTLSEATPYHQQPGAEPAAGLLLSLSGGAEAAAAAATAAATAAEGGAEGEAAASGEAAAAGAGGGGGEGEEGAAAGFVVEASKKKGDGEEEEGKLEGPKEGDVAGEVYATPSSPRTALAEKGGPMEPVVDGDAWRIAKAFAAQLQRVEVEILGEKMSVDAPLVQVRGAGRRLRGWGVARQGGAGR
jgi:hypothetical protein